MDLGKITRDFISRENRKFRFALGETMASSLAGFVVGALVATIVLVTGYIVFSSDVSIF